MKSIIIPNPFWRVCVYLSPKLINIVPISFKELKKCLWKGAETSNYSDPKRTS